jgi:biopolymer transport protein ExbD
MLEFGKIQRRSPRVNMIPIINVVFLILIYFITQGSFEKADPIAVNVPYSSTASAVSADPVLVYVTANELVLDKENVTPEILRAKLAEIAEKTPNKQVLLKADANLDSTKLIQLLKVIKQAKINNLYMVATTR